MRTLGMFSIGVALLAGSAFGCGGEGPSEATAGPTSTPSAETGGAPDDAGVGGDSATTHDTRVAPTDTGSTAPRDGGAPSDTGGGDGCAPGGADEPDDDGIDSNCDGADGKVGFDVYVDATSGIDSNEGTPTSPKATLERALEKASITGGSVLVAVGEFRLESLNVSGRWRIIGGYDKTFRGKPMRDRTVLHAKDATGLLLTGTGVEASLEHLRILGTQPTSDRQPSAYALRARVERLRLDDVFVRAADGRLGVAGEPGEIGSIGVPGRDATWSYSGTQAALVCNGVAQPSWTAGAEADNAEGGERGLIPSRAAAIGSSGMAGTDGDNASKAPVLVDGLLTWSIGQGGLANGTPGFGGAGGAANVWNISYRSPSGGSGGCPGGGGKGGASGGSSIAIVMITGALKVTRSTIESGFAGGGGDGGAGGGGGPAGRGGYPLDKSAACTLPAPNNCAEWGGNGGAGGSGGRGGGGAGGWTIGVVRVGVATSEIDAATVFGLKAGGVGGLGKSGGFGSSGDKVREYTIAAN